jgi:hypothetical protein
VPGPAAFPARRTGTGFSAGPGVEENRAVSPAEAVNDTIPVVDGAKAAAKKEQRRCAAWVVDGVELSVGNRDVRWRDMFGPFALG